VRFSRDGKLELAGSHEDPLVYRKRSGRGEFIATQGVWVGILDDIRESTPDQELRLEPGDILVLYTDGIVEARNAHGVQLGRERLQVIVEEHAQGGPEAIQTALFEAVSAWTPLIADDLTCLIARYQPG
jgi:serine phosphatase RsbU (regulator of sigma subunit)